MGTLATDSQTHCTGPNRKVGIEGCWSLYHRRPDPRKNYGRILPRQYPPSRWHKIATVNSIQNESTRKRYHRYRKLRFWKTPQHRTHWQFVRTLKYFFSPVPARKRRSKTGWRTNSSDAIASIFLASRKRTIITSSSHQISTSASKTNSQAGQSAVRPPTIYRIFIKLIGLIFL